MDIWVAYKQEQGGTRGTESGVGGRKKKGRAQDSPSGILTSPDCSAAAGAQPSVSREQPRESEHSHYSQCRCPAEMHTREFRYWLLLEVSSCFVQAGTLDVGDREPCCAPGRCAARPGWICHRWNGGERQAVVRCTERRGEMRPRRAALANAFVPKTCWREHAELKLYVGCMSD